MATISFNSTLTKVSSSQISLANSTYIGLAVKLTHDDHLINTLSGSNYTIPNSYAYAGLIYSGVKTLNITSTTAFSTATFADGVYQSTISESYDDGNTYVSTAYCLVTTAIDASIASFPTDSVFGICKKRALEYYRDLLQTAFDDADYTLCNDYFNAINTMLSGMQAPFNGTLSLIDNNTFNIVVPSVTGIDLFYQTNQLWNTLTQDLIDSVEIANEFLIPNGSGSLSIDSSDVLALPIYSDGVYFFEAYCVRQDGVDFDSNPVFTNLVTTTIDAQFAVFEANYDPNNAAQAASYQAMLTAFATINTLSNDLATNYAAINTQIELIQSELALFVTLNMTLVYNKNTSNLDLTIVTSLPNVTYSNQSLVVVGNDTKYVSSTFPSSYIDTTLAISSTMFGAYLADGVYQANLSWNTANDMEFSGVTYGLITENIDCGIAKYSAKIVKACNDSALKTSQVLLTYRKMVDLAFVAGDYATAATLIGEIQIMLTKLKCNC